MKTDNNRRGKSCLAVVAVFLLLISASTVAALPLGNIGYSGSANSSDMSPWDGSIASEFEDGDGTANDPYIIADASQLALLAELVNKNNQVNNANAHFKLAGDILLNGLSTSNVWSEGLSPANTWVPIGSAESPFKANFDGDGFTVFGLYMNGADNQGMFGVLGSNSTVENINTESGFVNGQNYVGGIAGYADAGSKINNCSNSMKVSGNAELGGIAGHIENGAIVEQCLNSGTITGIGDCVGGIAGSAVSGTAASGGSVVKSHNSGIVISKGDSIGGIVGDSTGIVENNHNSGTVNGKNAVGGIVGKIMSSGRIMNSYNTGNIAGNDNIGGIAGNAVCLMIVNCYTSGNVVGTGASGAVAGSTFFSNISYTYALEGSNAQLFANGNGSNQNAFFTSDGRVVVTVNGVNKTTLYAALSEWVTPYLSYYVGWINAPLPTLSIYPGYVSSVWTGGTETPTGSGTIDDPYRIRNGEQLAYVANQINAGNTTKYNAPEIHYRMTGHIVLNETANWKNWETSPPSKRWTPISGETNGFNANFSGAGFTVSGLYVNGTSYQGLFGLLAGGYVENIGIVDSYVKGADAVGSIAGMITGTSVLYGCYSTGTVVGTGDNVSGITGIATNPVNGYVSTIHGCYNTGSVTGWNSTGGVIGNAVYVKIVNCYNSGTVIGNENIGGVMGQGAEKDKVIDAKNCVNKGTVLGYRNVGGISGIFRGTLNNSYNSGDVSSTSINTGGIAGNFTGTVRQCHNNGTVQGLNTVGGVIGTFTGKVSECINYGIVSGTGTSGGIGGVVGSVLVGGVLSDSSNNGTVSSKQGAIGGIAGTVAGSIFNSFNTGTVKNSSTSGISGGIVGTVYNGGTVENCYNTASVSGSTILGAIAGTVESGGKMTYCYGSNTVSKLVGSQSGTVTQCSIFSSTNGSIDNPVVIGGSVKNVIKEALKGWVALAQNSIYASWSDDTFPVLLISTGLDPDVWNNNTSFTNSQTYAFVGSGTAANPYRIRNRADLELLSDLVGNTTYNSSGLYYRMTGNIMVNDISGWQDWNTSSPSMSWNPIGTSVNSFAANFNGGGYSVFGLYADNSRPGQGLFGFVKGGVLENIGVEYGYLETTYYPASGLVGSIQNGKLLNSFNGITVVGTGFVGGVVGMAESSLITNCYNYGMVTGSASNIGGVTGYMKTSTIFNTYNSGDVKAIDGGADVGGIVGGAYYSNKILNSYNTGAVSILGPGNYVGGIVGESYSNNTISNTYNAGIITINKSDGVIGTIVGQINDTSGDRILYSYSNVAGNFTGGGDASNCRYFDQSGILSAPIMINEVNYYNISNAMNAWVYLQPSTSLGSYLYFSAGDSIPYVLSERVSVHKISSSVKDNTGGTIDPLGDVMLFEGDGQRYTFSPSNGYVIKQVLIDGISDDDAKNDEEYTFTNVRSSHTISVEFERSKYAISSSVTGAGGSISPFGNLTVQYEDNVQFTFTPDKGYKIKEVLIDGVPDEDAKNNAEYSFENISDDHTISVEFEKIPYNITSTVQGNGIISPESSVIYIDEEQEFTLTPDAGWKIKSVTVNGSAVTPVNNKFTITGIAEDQHIIVVYVVDSTKTWDVTSEIAEGDGDISPKDAVLAVNETQEFTLTPDAGWKIKSVTVNGSAVTPVNNKFTITGIAEDQHIIVVYVVSEIPEWTISASTDGNGSVTPITQKVNHGDKASVIITPDVGFVIDSITDNGSEVNARYNGNGTWIYTMKSVTKDHNISVCFTLKQYSLVLNTSGGNGSFQYSVDGGVWIDYANGTMIPHGSTVTVRVTPEGGSIFKEWSGGYSEDIITIAEVSDDIILTAYLEPAPGGFASLGWGLLLFLIILIILASAVYLEYRDWKEKKKFGILNQEK